MIELPDSIKRQLEDEWGDAALSRRVLEALALEGYRTEALSAGRVAELLGLSVIETEAFLKEHGAYLHYTEEDLEQDPQTLDRLFNR